MNPEGQRTARPTGGLGVITARVVVCKFITSLAYMGVAALSARQLGPSGRGVLVLLLTLAAIGLLVCSLGVDIGGRVLLVEPEDPIPFSDYLGLSLVLAVVQVFACLAIGLTLLPLADVHLSAGSLLLFAVLGSSLLLQKLVNDGLVAYGLTVEAAFIETASFVVLVTVVAALALAGRHDLAPFVAAFVLQGSLQIVASLRRLRRTTAALRPRFHTGNWRRLIRTGLPGIGFGVTQLLAFRIDRYLVGILIGPAAVGVYSVAATAPELLRLAPTALAQSVVHRLASGVATDADFRRARTLCLAATLTLGVVTFLLAPLAVEVVFGPRFAGAVTPLRILLLAEIGMTIFSIDSAMLMGRARVADVAIASTIGLALVVGLDLYAIPAYGLAGAAWATVVAYSGMGAASNLLLKRRTVQRAVASTTDGPLAPSAPLASGNLDAEPSSAPGLVAAAARPTLATALRRRRSRERRRHDRGTPGT